MKKFIKKVIIGFTAITITITSFGSAFAMPMLLHQDKTSKKISGGVVHEHIKQFHANGWWNINVLRVNLDDEYTKVDAIFNNSGISKTDTVTNMVNNSGAIAGVNADYFEMKSPTFAFGPTISSGEIVGTPKFSDQSDLPAFILDNNNNPLISYWSWTMSLVAPDGSKFAVASVNKPAGSDYSLAIFNDKWGGTARSKASNDIVDLVVDSNDVVTAVRVNQPAITVPKGHQVISGKGFGKNFLVNNFPVGSKIKIETTGNVDFDNISTAVGGGSWLLKDGAKTAANINIPGNQPRTALGITKDKKQLIMLTIDGRNSVFSGVTMPVLADIMKSFGAHDAMNLDGGGSTTMAVKSREDNQAKVVNILSEGTQRRVINGLGIFDSAPIGEVDRLELSVDDKNTFINGSRSINVVGYDKYEHKVNINPNDIQFTVEGVEGSFDKSKFTPTTAGKAIIKANLNGALGELNLNVLDNLKELKFPQNKIEVDLSSTYKLGNISGIDGRGINVKVDLNNITFEIIGDIGKIENDTFYATDKPASGAIVARLNGVVKTIPVSIGFDNKPVNDLESLAGITTSASPVGLSSGTISLDSDSKVGNSSLRLGYDFTKTDKTRTFDAVLGSGIKIEGKPSAIGLWINGNSDKTWVRGDLIDANGKTHKLDFANSVDWTGWKNVSAKVPTDVAYPVTLKKIYVAQTDAKNKALGSIKIDGVTGLYAKDVVLDPSTVPTSSVFVDESNVASPVLDGGYKFLVSASAHTQGFKDRLSQNKFAFLLGALNPNMSSGLNTTVVSLDKGFKVDSFGSTKFVKVNNSNSGIRASGADQWLSMKSAIENATEKNIVLMLPKSIYSFKDKMEQELFLKLIQQYSDSGKNMHVVYGSNKTTVTSQNGVKYFEVNSGQAASGFEFVVNGDKVTYQLVK